MMHRPLLRVFTNGGVVAPADLVRVLDASEAAGNGHVHFGSRQDVLFPVSGLEVRTAVDVLRDAGLPFAPTSLERLRDPWTRRNIVSSYASVNVTSTTWWLTEDVYQYTLANFTEQPRVEVHLVDPAQRLVPLFGGQIHFVASTREHYWRLYLRDGDSHEGVSRQPGLFHGEDLPRVVGALETFVLANPGVPASLAASALPAGSSIVDEQGYEGLRQTGAPPPCYEGFQAMSNSQLWLGLYWRNNRFDIPFLRAACELCKHTRVGRISLTPWKSFLVKGIRLQDRARWEELMGAFGINTRHSSLELNWHIPLLDEEALRLKNDIVSELSMRDISTDGLTFTIRSQAEGPAFTTVVVEREPRTGAVDTYAIRFARGFEPTEQEYVTFGGGLARDALPSRLVDLTKLYWGRGGASEPGPGGSTKASVAEPPPSVGYQCRSCMTVYDARYGDATAGIEPGVPFDALPGAYVCPVCSADRSTFQPFAYA